MEIYSLLIDIKQHQNNLACILICQISMSGLQEGGTGAGHSLPHQSLSGWHTWFRTCHVQGADVQEWWWVSVPTWSQTMRGPFRMWVTQSLTTYSCVCNPRQYLMKNTVLVLPLSVCCTSVLFAFCTAFNPHALCVRVLQKHICNSLKGILHLHGVLAG